MKITVSKLRKIIQEVLEETKYDAIDPKKLHLEEEMDEYGRPTDKIYEQDKSTPPAKWAAWLKNLGVRKDEEGDRKDFLSRMVKVLGPEPKKASRADNLDAKLELQDDFGGNNTGYDLDDLVSALGALPEKVAYRKKDKVTFTADDAVGEPSPGDVDESNLNEQDRDADGDEDFADVMIARMVKSGMSKSAAIKKTSGKKYNEKPTKKKLSENLQYHVDHGVGVEKNVFRPGSEKFLALFAEARELSKQGLYEISSEESYYINETDLGDYGVYEGMKVPLDYPMVHEDELDEAEYKGREVELNKPRRGGRKKFYVYVKDPKTKNVKKVQWGSKDMSVKIADPARRKSFAARHRCKFTTKKDKATPRYWSCRTGRYPHLTGSKKSYKWW